jgi:hypothetical protein
LFYHDADEPLCRLEQGEKEFRVLPQRLIEPQKGT